MRRFVFMISLLMMASCGFTQPASFHYAAPNTPGGRMCTGACSSAQDYCQESCGISQRSCVGLIQAQAMQDYDQYSRTQFANRQPIELKARDFEDTSSCDATKKTCMNTCETRYQSCYESCGGVVTSSTSCSFLCL